MNKFQKVLANILSAVTPLTEAERKEAGIIRPYEHEEAGRLPDYITHNAKKEG